MRVSPKPDSRLLDYWTRPDRERKLFFCQIEALETVIYITEAAKKYGDTWIENALRNANDGANPGLFRLAFKMATGSGKTVVMGMLDCLACAEQACQQSGCSLFRYVSVDHARHHDS